MNNLKYSMDLILSILREDQNKGIPADKKYLTDLANQSGWLVRSLELMVEIDMPNEADVEQATDEDNVTAYYNRRELEDREEGRSASGYNSRGEMVELDFH